jgi:SNF family Na+-dependent transporter
MLEYLDLQFNETLSLGLGGIVLYSSVITHKPQLVGLGLLFLVIFVISQVVYYVRLLLVLINNGRTGTPDPEEGFEQHLHLNLNWFKYFAVISIIVTAVLVRTYLLVGLGILIMVLIAYSKFKKI